MRTARIASLAAFALVLMINATGCSSLLVGSWKADPVPAGEPYYIMQAEFKDDGTFTAIAKKGGETQPPLKGKYEFNGFALKLQSAGKSGDRSYPAQLRGWGSSTLQLTVNDKKHTLKKQ